jgi:hypothetical protein
MKWWYWHRFGAEALARQGAWDAAIAYSDSCRAPQGYDDRQIDRYCEDVLIKCGRADNAYHRYGLKTATGPTYLAIFRDTVKRYPDRDRRQVLLDLIETRGERGKWFAAAKDAGLLDVALLCARDYATEPATLVRAARDFAAREPKFAAEIGVMALGRLLNGGGYDPEASLVQEAFGHLTDAASRIGARDWAKQQVRALVDGPLRFEPKTLPIRPGPMLGALQRGAGWRLNREMEPVLTAAAPASPWSDCICRRSQLLLETLHDGTP